MTFPFFSITRLHGSQYKIAEVLNANREKISPTKWKSMEGNSLHTTGNKTLAEHLQSLDRITVITDADEESLYSQNLHTEDHTYGVV